MENKRVILAVRVGFKPCELIENRQVVDFTSR